LLPKRTRNWLICARDHRLSDDIRRLQKERGRHSQPEILCSLEIDDKLEDARLKDGQIGGLI